jgi:phage-related protein
MQSEDKPLVWLHGAVKTPPFSREARLEAGFLLRQLQMGDTLTLPHSRPMPSLGPHCHELRLNDQRKSWRIIYRIDEDAIIILDVFEKRTNQTPKHIIEICKQRLREYDAWK